MAGFWKNWDTYAVWRVKFSQVCEQVCDCSIVSHDKYLDSREINVGDNVVIDPPEDLSKARSRYAQYIVALSVGGFIARQE